MFYHVIISENNKLGEERHTLQLLENQLMMERLTEQINQLKKENMHLQQRSNKGNAQTM